MSELKVIKPSFRIFGDHTDPVEKVGEMARICYRSESAATPEANARLIGNCIKNGHTSVIEHGYMSIHFSTQVIDPKSFGVPEMNDIEAFSTQMLWQQYSSSEIAKYTEIQNDNTIYKVIDGVNAPVKIYQVVTGNFRAWLNILDSCMQASIAQGLPLGVAFICGIVVRGYERFPAVFGHLYEKINNAFAECIPDHYLRKSFMPKDAKPEDKLTIKHLEKFYNKFGIFVNASSPRSHLSVIVRTDRATTHQIVRHRRDCSYSQESQRYCNYQNKGYEVIWPAIDPVRYDDCTLDSKPHIPEGKTEAVVDQLRLEDSGFLPKNSSAFQTWLAAMEIAVDHYESMLKCNLYHHGEKPEADEYILPETARMVLPNAMASTIGITWTPATFSNIVYWRLEKHAQWPFRCLIGNIIIEGLRTNHEFFENFLPGKILDWIKSIADMKICTNQELIKTLVERQKQRQRNIEEAAKRYQEEMMKRAKEAEEKRKAEEQTKAEQKETPPSSDGQPAAAEK